MESKVFFLNRLFKTNSPLRSTTTPYHPMKPGITQWHLLLLMGHNQNWPAVETAGIGMMTRRQKASFTGLAHGYACTLVMSGMIVNEGILKKHVSL